MELLTDDRDPAWDEFARNHEHSSPFHELAWMRAVRDTYRHQPHYLLSRNSETGNVDGILPLFKVSGPFTGQSLISVPYGIYGGVVAKSQDVERRLLTEARELARSENVRYCELRGPHGDADGFSTRNHYVTFRKRLPSHVDDVLASFPRKARAAVRNAIDKHGLTAQYGSTLLDTFYRLYVLSLRRLASPPHSRRFFERLRDEYGERFLVQIVYHQGAPAMGVICFCMGKQFLPYWAGIDAQYNRTNVSNFAYYDLMEYAVRHGFEIFDFGRTRQDNTGGCSFKINQGFEPTPLPYSYHSPTGREPPDLRPSNRKFALAQSIWKHLPLPIVARLGAVVTRWIP